MDSERDKVFKDNLADYIMVFDDTFPADFCDATVARFEQDSRHVERDAERRSFTELDITELADWQKELGFLRNTMAEKAKLYQQELKAFFPDQFRWGNCRIKRYAPNDKHEFGRHVDAINMGSAPRFLAMFCYLNDVEKGGETWFERLDMKIKPVKGRMVLFPPLWLYVHSGCKPVSNAKYFIGTYLLFV